MADGVSCRLAGPADYQAVLDIQHHVYDGLDYVPALYHQMVTDKDTNVYVAEKDGKVIGLALRSVHLSGKAVYGGTGRVHPDYQNQKVNSTLQQYATDHFLRSHPNLSYMVFTGRDSPYFIQSVEKGLNKLLAKEVLTCVNQDILKLKQILNTRPHRGYTMTAYKHLAQEDVDDLIQLFQNKAFLASNRWLPFEATPSGIKEAQKFCNVMVARGTDDKISGINFFSMIPCEFGRVAVTNHHGDDIECLKALLEHQLNHALKDEVDGKVAIWFSYPLHMDKEKVQTYLLQEMKCSLGPRKSYHGLAMGNRIDKAQNKL